MPDSAELLAVEMYGYSSIDKMPFCFDSDVWNWLVNLDREIGS